MSEIPDGGDWIKPSKSTDTNDSKLWHEAYGTDSQGKAPNVSAATDVPISVKQNKPDGDQSIDNPAGQGSDSTASSNIQRDASGRITSIGNPNGPPNSGMDFKYDAQGNLVQAGDWTRSSTPGTPDSWVLNANVMSTDLATDIQLDQKTGNLTIIGKQRQQSINDGNLGYVASDGINTFTYPVDSTMAPDGSSVSTNRMNLNVVKEFANGDQTLICGNGATFEFKLNNGSPTMTDQSTGVVTPIDSFRVAVNGNAQGSYIVQPGTLLYTVPASYVITDPDSGITKTIYIDNNGKQTSEAQRKSYNASSNIR